MHDSSRAPSPKPTSRKILISSASLIVFGASCFLAGMVAGAFTYGRGVHDGQQESTAEIRALSAKPGLPVQLKQ